MKGTTAPARRRLQVLAASYVTIGGLVAMGLLLARWWVSAFVAGIAVTLALVGGAARRSEVPGALAILLAYAFAWGLFVWAGLFFVAMALWGGGQ